MRRAIIVSTIVDLVIILVVIAAMSMLVYDLHKQLQAMQDNIEVLQDHVMDLSGRIVLVQKRLEVLEQKANEIPEVRLPDRYYAEPVKETSKMEVPVNEVEGR